MGAHVDYKSFLKCIVGSIICPECGRVRGCEMFGTLHIPFSVCENLYCGIRVNSL